MIKVAMFQTHKYEKEIFDDLFRQEKVEITFIESGLNAKTANMAKGHQVVLSFVNDTVDRETIKILYENKVHLIALRCAGFNHVDIKAAEEFGIPVVRVPAYSPQAVAEHTVCLLLTLNRKVHNAYLRVRSLNFSIEGLVGFDLFGKTVGVIGTGKIGAHFAKIMNGFGCKLLAFDTFKNPGLSGICTYVALNELLEQSDIISLHVPLTPDTYHLLGHDAFKRMKPGVVILNTSRGGLIDSKALIDMLKSGQVGGAGLDVYEEEEGVFFHDLSDRILEDDLLARLLTFPNTIITSHQAFLTREALEQIARTTLRNIRLFFKDGSLEHPVLSNMIRRL